MGQVKVGASDYLVAWLVSQGVDRRTARRRVKAVLPALLGLIQGYWVSRALFGVDAVATYFDAVDLMLAPLAEPS